MNNDNTPINSDNLTFEDVLELIEEAALQEDIESPYAPLDFNDED